MGGPSGSTINTQNQLTQQQLGIAQTANDRASEQYGQYKADVGPLEQFARALTGGDATATNTAAAPFITQITGGMNAAEESVRNNTPKGAVRDYALSQIPVQTQTQIASTKNNLVNQGYQTLAQIGAGAEGFSLQNTGAAVSAGSSASSSNQSIMQAQEQAKASTMGFLGSLLGAGATAYAGRH